MKDKPAKNEVILKIQPQDTVVDSTQQARYLRDVTLRPQYLTGDKWVVVDVNDVDSFSTPAAEVLIVPWLKTGEPAPSSCRAPVGIKTYSTTVRDAFSTVLKRADEFVYWLPAEQNKHAEQELIGNVPSEAPEIMHVVRDLGDDATEALVVQKLTTQTARDAFDRLKRYGALVVKDGDRIRVPFGPNVANGHTP